MQKTGHNLPEIVRAWRAEVVTIQVETNREFFDEFEAALNHDEEWASKFLREYRANTRDPEDTYFEVVHRKSVRKKKGLPPRVTILPDWDCDDERRYDEREARNRELAGRKQRKTAKTRTPKARNRSQNLPPNDVVKPESERWIMKRKAAVRRCARNKTARGMQYPGVRGKVVDRIEQHFAISFGS